MENISDRNAQFVCVISMSAPNGETTQFKGTVKGEITTEPIGDHGFGYDPIFYVPSLNKTMAQLSDAEKAKISHRGHAIEQLQQFLAGEKNE